MAEKCKPYEIQKRMSDVYRKEACFRQKNVYNLAKQVWVEPKLKRQSMEWKITVSLLKKKFCVQ